MCVSPGGTDKLVLLRTCDYVTSAIRDVLSEVWTLGIQAEREEEVLGGAETLREFKLRGHPWYGEGEESTLCRKLLLELVGKLGTLKWRLVAATNLKGGTDSLFFIYDADHHLEGSRDLAMLSLSRHDRIRLLNFGSESLAAVRLAILNFYQTKEPEERNYYGSFEFKVRGYPFASSGSESVSARQLVCRLLECLREVGWEAAAAIDLSRKTTDKSALLFRRCESANLSFACLAMSDVDRIRMLNFPVDMAKHIRAFIEKAYMPGIAEVRILVGHKKL